MMIPLRMINTNEIEEHGSISDPLGNAIEKSARNIADFMVMNDGGMGDTGEGDVEDGAPR